MSAKRHDGFIRPDAGLDVRIFFPQANDPRTQPQLVRITAVAASSESTRSFTGVVTARVQSDLGFRVPGKVTKRLVDVGQVVRTGQPLMRIDITDYAHAITTQAENVAAVKARAEQAAADEARYRGLVSTGAVSASTYDLIKATADSAQAQLAAAKAQEKIARDQGDYSVLLADSDGTVVETLAEPGQVVSAGQSTCLKRFVRPWAQLFAQHCMAKPTVSRRG